MSKCASLTIGTVASHNSRIPTSMDNSVLCVRGDDNGHMSLVLTG